MDDRIDVAVVGATTLAGEQLVEALGERDFPVRQLHLLDAAEAAGTRIEFRGSQLAVRDLAGFDFAEVPLAIFVAGADVADEYVPRATDAGCAVVDTSSRFRAEPDVPLVIAAVNPQALDEFRERRIAATPAPEVVQLLCALEPLRAAAGIERLHVTTLLPVSRRGRAGVEELAGQTAALLNAQPIATAVFPVQIAFNVLPDIEGCDASGYTESEQRLVRELRRVWAVDELPVQASVATIAGFHGCLQDVYIVPGRSLTPDRAAQLLAARAGVRLLDAGDGEVPSAIEAVGQSAVFVGRVRESTAEPGALALWVAADNLRLGVAENAVRVAELVVKGYL
jgi:aspartate-semialdehyde dehydrogenase